MVIYKITNLINNKIYVGKDSKNNPNYLGSGLLIKRAIKKYGKEYFIKEILEICDTIENLNEKEIYWIEKLNSCDKNIGYNLTIGGTGGNTVMDEEKRKEINQRKKDVYSQLSIEERAQKFGHSKGKKNPMSEDAKQKISAKNSGINNGMYGKTPWNKNKNDYTDEERLKFGQHNKGKVPWNKGIPATEEQKKNQSNKMKGRKLSVEHKTKIKEALAKSEKFKQSIIKKTGKESPNKGGTLSAETKEKIKKTMTGKETVTKGTTWVYNVSENIYKRVKKEELDIYLKDKWIKQAPNKGRAVSEEVKNKISQTLKAK